MTPHHGRVAVAMVAVAMDATAMKATAERQSGRSLTETKTDKRLGHDPAGDDGLIATVTWLRELGKVTGLPA